MSHHQPTREVSYFLIAVIKGFDKCNLEETESQCEGTVHHGAEVKVLEV